MNRQNNTGKAISVNSSLYDDLASGRLKVVRRPCDDWNLAKFCSRRLEWLYVCKTNDVLGECLKIRVKSVSKATCSAETDHVPAILIQLGEIAEIRNRRTGERTFIFPPGE